ncbi:hypothetical protein DPSP01_001994 [Paraphaeosphaeria sporulosa]|uniref:Uncharacterized protein n=1 Tax=Paraphaeosphaeria sporulosa TaxID=1460663 RepID=A0A177CZQ8_9PLEO|nr:uncharacterized protein CC84DRAFT_1159846 [Paraphaeosphaeria sporulosa]OAG12558.1 hypothetical protein CC84DRAFT_1159846 [Paraphaeosphaeria sporulosa]
MNNTNGNTTSPRPECHYSKGNINTTSLPENGSWVAIADAYPNYTRAMAQCCGADHPSDFYGPDACFRYCNVTDGPDGRNVKNVSDCLTDTFGIPWWWVHSRAQYNHDLDGAAVRLGNGGGKMGLLVLIVGLLGVFGGGI